MCMCVRVCIIYYNTTMEICYIYIYTPSHFVLAQNLLACATHEYILL